MKDKAILISMSEKDYNEWLNEVGRRFCNSQVRAVTKVNEELLRFYWTLGRDIVMKNYTNTYGTGFFAKLSNDLKKQFPDIKSFSVTNLNYMKYFYELYSNCPQLGDDLGKRIFRIPWGHNKLIIDKCKNNRNKALFYVTKTLENNWSRAVLMNFLETDLSNRSKNSPTS